MFLLSRPSVASGNTHEAPPHRFQHPRTAVGQPRTQCGDHRAMDGRRARAAGHLSRSGRRAVAACQRSLAGLDATETANAGRALQEFLDADVIVIGAPMYNFGIPSTLKAWIDRLAVAGKTFQYTASGAEGLAGGKKIIVASTRGGFHQQSGGDFQEPYLRYMFGFFGITDVEIVRAEGLAVSPEQRTEGMAAAHLTIATPPPKAA